MRTAIVDLEPDGQGKPAGFAAARSSHDRGLIAALSVACAAFALAVWLGRAAAPTTAVTVRGDAAVVPSVSTVAVPVSTQVYDRTGQRLLYALALPPNATNVDLGMLPDRLTNEPLPSAWLVPITVRGAAGIASADGLTVIAWTERGMLYWLSSTSLTTDQLIQVAEDMR